MDMKPLYWNLAEKLEEYGSIKQTPVKNQCIEDYEPIFHVKLWPIVNIHGEMDLERGENGGKCAD